MANKQGSCYVTGRFVSSLGRTLEQKRGGAEVVQQADSRKEETLTSPGLCRGGSALLGDSELAHLKLSLE